MYYQNDLYVTDLGIVHSDIERFIANHVRRTVASNRFGSITHNTIPAFRDFSESVYAGRTIDLAMLARPDVV